MELTDILSQYLYEIQYEKLKSDETYRAAKAARNEKEQILLEALTRKQRRLFHDYAEQAAYLDALELRHLFSHCSILLTESRK